MGPLVRATTSQNKVLLVILDVYSKIVELCALRDEKTEKMVDFIFLTFCRYGFPTGLISDGGPQFVSNIYNALLKKLGVKPIRIAPYVNKCNPVERVMRNIKAYLRAFISENQKTWDTSLSELTFMLRSVMHASTGFTPSELMFGRKMYNPLFNRPEFQLVIPDTVEGFDLNFKDMVETMKLYATTTRELMEECKIKQKFFHDKNVSEVIFNIGDVVKKRMYVLSSAIDQVASSLTYRFEPEPLKIIGKLGENIYILSKLDKNEFYSAAHSSQIFHFNSRDPVDVTIPDEIRIPLNRMGKVTGPKANADLE